MFVRLNGVKTVKMKLEVAIMRTYCETEIIIERYNRTFVCSPKLVWFAENVQMVSPF